MRNICVVTNYNYARYLNDSLSSIEGQSTKFDLIIIVDDGSTDDSQSVVDTFCRNCSYAVNINKINGGQLSCFNTVLELIKPEDFVFFLDSDDVFPRDYVEQITRIISVEKADFVFVNPVNFTDGGVLLRSACLAPQSTFTFSSTSALTRRIHCWIGAATSCISMRGSLLHAILPYPFEKDWVTRADDVLVFGASVIGASKLYVQSIGVNYRIHGSNNFAGKRLSPQERTDWRLRHERLFTWFSQKSALPRKPSLKNTVHEAMVIPKSIRKVLGVPSPVMIFFFDLLLAGSTIRELMRDLVGTHAGGKYHRNCSLRGGEVNESGRL